jgi:hypothetical protein
MEIDPKTGAPVSTITSNDFTPPPSDTPAVSIAPTPNNLNEQYDAMKNLNTELSEGLMLCETENKQLREEVLILNNRKPHLSLSKKQQIEVSLTRTSMDSQQRARVMEELELIINA